MSGAFGYHRGNNTSSPTPANRDFSQAYQGHQSPGKARDPAQPHNQVIDIGPGQTPAGATTTIVDPNLGKNRDMDRFQQTVQRQAGPRVVPTARHSLTSTAANVLVIIADVTGSMGVWPKQIFQRLPLLWNEYTELLGSEDLEILFIAFGDAAQGDRYPLQVTRFGRGEELDSILASIEIEGHGGGNGRESSELAAYYLLERVDTSTARNIFGFFISDERGYDRVDRREVEQILGVDALKSSPEARDVFARLSRKLRMFAITMNSQQYDYREILRWWNEMLPERVSELEDPRRAVDVIMGVMAGHIGKSELFNTRLHARQLGKDYGAQNIQTVQRSVLMVQGPGGRSRLKLPGPPVRDKTTGDDDWV